MMVLKIGDFVDYVDCAGDVLTVPVPKRWFLLRTHPNKEFVVFDGIDRRGFSAYVPTFQVNQPTGRMRSNGQRLTRVATRPVFPGIVFVPDFEANLEALRKVDGVINFLKFGAVPASMSTRLMADVRRFAAFMNLPAKERKAWEPSVGGLVMVNVANSGWVEGRIDRLDANGRLRVLIAAMQREIAVTVTGDQVEPV